MLIQYPCMENYKKFWFLLYRRRYLSDNKSILTLNRNMILITTPYLNLLNTYFHCCNLIVNLRHYQQQWLVMIRIKIITFFGYMYSQQKVIILSEGQLQRQNQYLIFYYTLFTAHIDFSWSHQTNKKVILTTAMFQNVIYILYKYNI
ncbi:hypothetical protein SS50377_21048 [Spironucleus salmonicida]|uniref:Uncharacterized protein n=1 Tax=Spironucleus salmonicida TaxID=348837 RepID=A0A9P8M003_9EUKA|nr:hypothetical protein SS50377_21048 [Spironucleus salmonicida]